MLIMFKIKYLLFITPVICFNIIQNIQNIKYISNKNLCNIYMNYDPLKGYQQKLNIIQSFHASIVINNWINYLSKDKEIDNMDINKCSNDAKFIETSIYDMKSFISINKYKKNTIIFAWTPEVDIGKSNIIYIIGGKIMKDELYIFRIAQCPYYNNILSINSKNVVCDIKNLVNYSSDIAKINYEELHKYDNRYLLSWTMYN